MKKHKRVNFSFLLLFIFLVFGTFPSAQSAPAFDEHRPEGLMVGDFGELPHFEDGADPVEPPPLAPEIIPWSKVVFQRYGNSNYDVYIGNDDGTAQQRLTFTGANDLYPNLNRGASRIVFASNREANSGDYDLYIMNADGSNVGQLTFTGGDAWNAEFSPDGTKIAFQSVVNNQSDVFVMNVNGTGLVNVTNHPDYDGAPTWSPDGTQLAFVSRRSGGYRIYTMNANGTNVLQRSSQPYSNNPAWSPDGQRIAYDADIDNRSRIFPEVWMMNADGTGQTIIYKPITNTDALVSGWSPDGSFITFTRVELILYNGTWYWQDAHLNAVRWYDTSSLASLSPVDLDWLPHWQTTEIQPPQSAVHSLPAQSGNPIPVSWSGSDTGEAGIRAYDIQVRKGLNGPWTDWLVYTSATSGNYSGGVGGETYYFRSRAWDQAHNLEAWPAVPDAFTMIDNVAPVSAVSPLYPYTRNGSRGFFVSWSGSDAGGSGIINYDVQYRNGNGSWSNFVNATPLLTEVFSFGNYGQTIYFRSRARDAGQNVENWPGGNGDTQTTLYFSGARGVVYDNGHAPIVGAGAVTVPAAVGFVPSDSLGQYGAFVSSATSEFSVALQKAGYGNHPAAIFPSKFDAVLDIVLPPADDLIVDGGFESGGVGGPWMAGGGSLPMTVAQDEGHTGDYHLQMGTPSPQFAPPFNIGDPSGNGIEGPRVVGRADGRTYFFWTETDGLNYRWRNPDGTLSTFQKVGTAGSFSDFPTVLLDSQGNIHAAWRSGSNYFYSQLKPNNTWTPVVTVNGGPDVGNNRDAQMVLDDQDRPHVVWYDVAQDFIEHTYRLPNGNWTTPTNTAVLSYNPSGFQVAVDGGGNPHIVWAEFASDSVFYTYRDGSSWTTPVQLNGANEDAYGQAHALADGDGGIYLLWTVNQPTSDSGIYFRHWTAESGLSPSQQVIFSTQFGAVYDVVVSGDGTLSLVWYAVDKKLYYTKRDPHGFWSSAESFGTIGYQLADLRLAVDKNGRPHVVWATEEFGAVPRYFFYRYQKTDGTWSNSILLNNMEFRYETPDIAFDYANGLHITYALSFGDLAYHGPTWVQTADSKAVSQVVEIPGAITAPVLSFMYQLGGAFDTADSNALLVELDDGTTTTPILQIQESTGTRWTHGWSDLSNWSGQIVTLTFTLEQAADAPVAWARIDDVTLGTGYPDLWSALGDGAGFPGQEVAVPLTYGNQGGVSAAGVHITQTLPAGLTFVSASVAPISTSPLVWDVGDIPSGSGPVTIMVTLKIANSAPPLVYLTSSLDISPTGPELETANNSSQGQIYTGLPVFMPIVLK